MEKTSSVTLNLSTPKITKEINQNASIHQEEISTPTKPLASLLSREYTYNTPKRRSSQRRCSMLNASRATPVQQQQTTINEEEPNSPLIVSKSMLGILLTQPTEAEPSVLQSTLSAPITPTSVRVSTQTTINEETTNSPSVVSKSMLGILLTQPTEAEPNVSPKTITTPISVRTSTQPTINEESTNSPSVVSKSMLGILLTQPTEAEPSVLQKTLTTSVVSSPLSISAQTTRKSDRLSSNPTPRVSINPLHSSTPSSSRHKSLQMVSIGEQEQVSITVPQQINIEIQEEEEEQQIEIVPLNDTEASIPQPSSIRTTEIGIQTTPSLDVSSRRRLNALEPQTTPIVQINKSSSVTIINEEQRQMTPLQTKLIMNLQRNVRFQLTPSTDARLVVKEQLEENLRGLKPDIIINPTPIIPQTKLVKTTSNKKAAKPKKKVIASKKKKVAATKKTESVSFYFSSSE